MSLSRLTRPLAAAAVAVAALFAVVAGTTQAASADPNNGVTLTVACANGSTYVATTSGNGHFTPAHVTNATTMLIPLSFGPQTQTVTDPSGNILSQQTFPGSSK